MAHDLGQRLGTGAHLAALVRLSSGCFTLQEAVSLERLEEAFRHEQQDQYLFPMDEALLGWPAIIASAEEKRRIMHGQGVPGDQPAVSGENPLCRAYDADGQFLAILAYDIAGQQWRPKKVFASEQLSDIET
jgi:tRNA pseudouridine55 synthase